MDITTRHIRHDWPEWIDWNNQKTVKTMCGVRSRPGLCGIPGVTEQSALVQKNGGKVWGWCMHCVRVTFPYYLPPALTEDVTSQAILDLHEDARTAIVYQYHDYLVSRHKQWVRNGQTNGAGALLINILKLEDEYPWLLTKTFDPKSLLTDTSAT